MRTSTKTQRRLKQQQMCSPYALTGDVYCETPTFRMGGLVTTAGLLQLVTVLALSGFVFGGALFFCAVLLATLGIGLYHHSDAKAGKQGLGVKQVMNRLLALRRSAFDYSLTLSIAQSDKYKQSKDLPITMVPSSSTPQKVVAAVALKEEEALKTRQNRKTKPLADTGPLMTVNRVHAMPMPTISSLLVETTEVLIMEKPRANSEPKQVLRSRPLLPLTAKVQNLDPVQEKTTEERPTSTVLKTLAKQGKKTMHVQAKAKLTQSQQKKAALEAPKASAKKQIQLPAVLPETEPKVAIPAMLSIAKPVVELPKPKMVEIDSTVNVERVASAVVPLSVFPERKPLIEVAHGEAAIERDLIVTRKVLLYLNSNVATVVNLEEQDWEQETECERDVELEHEPKDFGLSLEAFPPLPPPMVLQVSMSLPATDIVEQNFLMDIELEPISKPEKVFSLSSVHFESVGNVDLPLMMDELDAMRLELDAAMACCTSLHFEVMKVSSLT